MPTAVTHMAAVYYIPYPSGPYWILAAHSFRAIGYAREPAIPATNTSNTSALFWGEMHGAAVQDPPPTADCSLSVWEEG